MGYWMRVFCTEGDPPALDRVVEHRPNLRLRTELGQNAVEYRGGKAPFLTEINRTDDPEAEASDEIGEFVALLEDLPDTPSRQIVLTHLKRTRFVVATQIPTSDFEDDGYEAVGDFMNFFVENNGGLIQADGEGFYDGGVLIVGLE